MTSLLAGMLVEEGRLRWDSKVGDSFLELAPSMDPGLSTATLERLLSHSSGLPSDDEFFGHLLERSYTTDNLNLDELRAWLIREWGSRPLASQPGVRFAYSNFGYLVAGAMLEKATGRTWEELVSERIFDTLLLRSAGLGPQSTPGRIDAPLGHAVLPDGTPKPMLAGPNGDGPPILGPAGLAHMSILDFAAWANWHAGAGRRGPALVGTETLRRLHTAMIDIPPKPGGAAGTPRTAGQYAMGWGIMPFPWSAEPALTHNGSNTMNLAMIIVRPDRDAAVVLATNLGGDRAEAALLAVAEELDRENLAETTRRELR